MNQQHFEVKENNLEQSFSQSDQDFILSHLDGCNSHDLAKQIKIVSIGALNYHLRNGSIKGLKKNGRKKNNFRYWLIPPSEIIRIIDLYSNWITCSMAAKKINKNTSTFRLYAIKNAFGPIKKALGMIWIRKIPDQKMLKMFNKKSKELKTVEYYLSKRKIKNNYLSAKEAAEILGFSFQMVGIWIKLGYLTAVKQKGVWQITRKDLSDFRNKVIAREFKYMRQKTREKMRLISVNKINAPY
ncbi:MAG: helix-turn-helix domain-containing protein [Patescibacteria group bacterium]|nr:helix-turn-helix domain-containing protein [Patescibacteria group bacterium]